jgi:hypothetical protein
MKTKGGGSDAGADYIPAARSAAVAVGDGKSGKPTGGGERGASLSPPAKNAGSGRVRLSALRLGERAMIDGAQQALCWALQKDQSVSINLRRAYGHPPPSAA